jgi:ribosomal protein S8
MSQLLSKIRVGLVHKRFYIKIKKTNYIFKVLNVLWNENLIYGFYESSGFFIIFLKYDLFGQPIIKDLVIISRPGNRKYFDNVEKQLKFTFEQNIMIFTETSNGIMPLKRAYNKNLGGELLFMITF